MEKNPNVLQRMRETVLKTETRRAENLSRGNINSDWDTKHPDYVRDLKTNPSVMKKAIKTDLEKLWKLHDDRRAKLNGQ